MMRRRGDWPEIIAEQPRSGKSVDEYCKSKGIHPNTFYRKRKLYGRSAMVEILPLSNRESAAIVVSFGEYSVAIRKGFDAESLKSILRVIGEL